MSEKKSCVIYDVSTKRVGNAEKFLNFSCLYRLAKSGSVTSLGNRRKNDAQKLNVIKFITWFLIVVER